MFLIYPLHAFMHLCNGVNSLCVYSNMKDHINVYKQKTINLYVILYNSMQVVGVAKIVPMTHL